MEARKKHIRMISILFLTVLVVLTLFSNTLMNFSLPVITESSVKTGVITEKVHGSGPVEISTKYEVVTDAERVVKSVPVRVGSIVSAGDTVMYLDPISSDALTEARTQLRSLQLDYDKLLISYESSDYEIQNARKDLSDALDAQAAVPVRVAAAAAARATTRSAQAKVDNLTTYKDALQTELQSVASDGDIEPNATGSSAFQNAENTYLQNKRAYDLAKTQVDNNTQALSTIEREETACKDDMGGTTLAEAQANLTLAQQQLATAQEEYDYLARIYHATENQENVTELELLQAEQSMSLKDLEVYQKQQEVNSLKTKVQNLTTLNTRLIEIQSRKNNMHSTLISSEKAQQTAKLNFDAAKETLRSTLREEISTAGEDLTAAKAALNAATDLQTEADNANTLTAQDAAKEVRTAQKTLYDLIARGNQTSNTNQLELQEKKEALDSQTAVVARLQQLYEEGKVITARGGTVLAIHYQPGERTTAEKAAVVIQTDGSLYTVSFPVSLADSKKVKIGDQATISGVSDGELTATLYSIQDGQDNVGKQKTLTFQISGNTTVGQTLSLSLSQNSQKYDMIVPNSAIQEGSSGKFIYVLQTKSSALGDRYSVSQINVEVLASDDENSAISGSVYAGDYVVSTASKPLQDGAQVRLSQK